MILTSPLNFENQCYVIIVRFKSLMESRSHGGLPIQSNLFEPLPFELDCVEIAYDLTGRMQRSSELLCIRPVKS
jgi:hypothetical protein